MHLKRRIINILKLCSKYWILNIRIYWKINRIINKEKNVFRGTLGKKRCIFLILTKELLKKLALKKK